MIRVIVSGPGLTGDYESQHRREMTGVTVADVMPLIEMSDDRVPDRLPKYPDNYHVKSEECLGQPPRANDVRPRESRILAIVMGRQASHAQQLGDLSTPVLWRPTQ
jgi:hypothetical protein